MFRRGCASIALAVAAVALTPMAAEADLVSWKTVASGGFNEGTNWNGNAVPGADDEVLFNLGSLNAYTVNMGSPPANVRLEVAKSNVTFNFNLARTWNLTLAGSGDSVAIGTVAGTGNEGRATISGSDSAVVRGTNGVVAATASGGGSLSILAGTLDLSGNFDVGRNGVGNLTLGGGDVRSGLTHVGRNNGSVGTASVSGDSTWTISGDFNLGNNNTGRGTVDLDTGATITVAGTTNVRNGGELNIDGSLTTGALAKTSAGVVNWAGGTIKITDSNFTIGTSGALGADVVLGGSKVLDVTQTVTVNSGASITVGTNERFKAGSLVNNGTVDLNQASTVFAGNLTNNAQFVGRGRVTGTVNNTAAGLIDIDGGADLAFGGKVTNAGAVNVSSGSATFTGGLDNSGLLALDEGNAVVNGAVHNLPGGQITLLHSTASGASGTFFGPVDNDGLIRVNDDALFKADVTGSGDFLNGGRITFESTYRPEGSVTFGGDVVFSGPSSRLILEIGGTEEGVDYDQLLVNRNITLGLVDVVLVGGFEPSLGDQFFLVSANVGGSITYGGAINLPTLPDGLSFDACTEPNCFILTVVPEPASLSLLGLGFAALAARRRR